MRVVEAVVYKSIKLSSGSLLTHVTIIPRINFVVELTPAKTQTVANIPRCPLSSTKASLPSHQL